MTLAVAAVAALGLGWLAHRLRLPTALGYLAAGLAFSPGVSWTPTFDAAILRGASEVGTLFLLFVIGLELDIKRLRSAIREGSLVALGGLVVAGLAVAAAGRLAGWGFTEAAALGISLSLSSTLFGERLTAGHTSVRNRVLGILLVEDILAVGLLALLVVLGGSGAEWWQPLADVGRLAVLFVLLSAFALLVVPRVLDAVARTHQHDLLVLVAAGLVLGFGLLGLWSGSALLGAFVAGVAAAEAGARFVARNAVQSLRDVALALFFFAAGATVRLDEVGGQLPLAALVALLFVVAKSAIHFPAALAAGLPMPAALRSSFALGTVGEFSLILAGAAVAQGLASPQLLATVVGTTLILLVLAPLLMALTPALARMAERLPEGLRRNLWLLIQSARRGRLGRPSREVRAGVRSLLANLLLLATWLVAAVAAAPLLEARIPSRTVAPIVLFGATLVVAIPLAFGTYRRYRDLVHLLVRGEGGAVRARLVDVWVAVSAILLLLPLAVLVPRALPVLAGGLVVALVVAAVAWRQLARFQRALEASVTRVLGHDPETIPLLDRVLERYPWGVRVSAVSVPSESPLAGRTVAEARLAEMSGATLAVIQRHRREMVNPGPAETIRSGDTLVLMGDDHQLARAEALVVAHGEALRLSAQSRLANLEEVEVAPLSELAGRPLNGSNLVERTGSRVVGLWVRGASHPEPFRDELVPQAGDRLIVLGSPLQVQRARLLAEGVGTAEGAA